MSGAAVNAPEAQNIFLSNFERLAERRSGKDPSWLRAIRQSAIERFAQLGFPHARMEEWRFTSVAPITKIPFQLAEREDQTVTIDQIRPLMFGEPEGQRLVFVNGHFCPEFSQLSSIPQGMIVTGLEQALERYPDRLESHLARYADIEQQAFAALNTAFIADGAFVYIPPGVVVEAPLHLLFLSTAPGPPLVSHPRNVIIVEPNSRVSIVEDYASVNESPCFTNPVTEVVVKENASIDHYRLVRESLQAFHIATQHTHQGRDARYLSYSLALGGALVRNDIRVVLDGEGSECILNGFYLVKDRQHVDHHTRIDHVTPHSNSREFYKGILDERGRGVFNGRIVVHPGAQKISAHQENKNLLLSKQALVNTNPQLEIHADDVKCSHGATIGQLDADALFYLRTRGIDLEAARQILIYAFARDLISRIEIAPVRTEVERALGAKLPDAPAAESAPIN